MSRSCLVGKEVDQLFEEYRSVAKNSVMINRSGEKDQKLVAEKARNRVHRELAEGIYKQLLQKGIYSDPDEDHRRGEIMGRMIARAWLVDVGEDYWAAARTMDVVRRLNAMPDEVDKKVLTGYQVGSSRHFRDVAFVTEARAHLNADQKELPPVELDKFYATDNEINPQFLTTGLPPDDNAEHDFNPLKERPYL